jgi:hypothetical protein
MSDLHIPHLNSSDLAVFFLSIYKYKKVDTLIDLCADNIIYRDNFHKLGGKNNFKTFLKHFFEEEFDFNFTSTIHQEEDSLSDFTFKVAGNTHKGQVLLHFNENRKVTLAWFHFIFE